MKERKHYEIELTEKEELKMIDIFNIFWINYRKFEKNLIAEYSTWWYIKIDDWWTFKEWCNTILKKHY